MSYFCTIVFNIILPPMLGFQKSLLLHFFRPKCCSHLSSFLACWMSRPSYATVFGKEVLYYGFLPLGPNMFLTTPNLLSSHNFGTHLLPPVQHTHRQFRHNVVFVFRHRTVAGTPGFNLLLNPSSVNVMTWDVTPCSLAELYFPQITRPFPPCSV